MNLYPYVPFYNYRKKWINYYLDELKIITNENFIKDYYNIDMSWELIEYYLELAYDSIYFGIPCGSGLRIYPRDLVYTVEEIKNN